MYNLMTKMGFISFPMCDFLSLALPGRQEIKENASIICV